MVDNEYHKRLMVWYHHWLLDEYGPHNFVIVHCMVPITLIPSHISPSNHRFEAKFKIVLTKHSDGSINNLSPAVQTFRCQRLLSWASDKRVTQYLR